MTNANQHGQPSASTGSDAAQKPASSAAPRKSERFDAFLSHNSQDKQDVEKIREKLEAAGITIWIDRNELSGGDSLPTTLKRALQNSAACIVFIGAHGVGPWQEKEITAADKLKWPKRRTIPVFMPGSNRELPASLKEKELLWIEFRDFDDQLALDKLIKDIRTKIKDQSRWDRTRRTLIGAGVLIPLLAIAWATKEFCTFQAEFASFDYDQQRQEIVITRRFDPRPKGRQFRQGTWVFKDEHREQVEDNQINDRLELNVGWSPDWSPLGPFLRDSRLCFAELEWLDRRVSAPNVILGENIVTWGRAAPQSVIEALAALLNGHDSDNRYRAAQSLVQLGKRDRYIIDALIALLQDQDSNVRLGAAESLAQLGESDTKVMEVILLLAKDERSAVREKAAESFGRLGKTDDRVIAALVALLKEVDLDVRNKAAKSLVQLGNIDAHIAESLVELLKDSVRVVRADAAVCLILLGRSDSNVIETLVSVLKERERDAGIQIMETMRRLGKKEFHMLDVIEISKNQDRIARITAAESLGKLGTNAPIVVEALVASLSDEEIDVRSISAKSLGQLRSTGENVIEALVKLLTDNDLEVRDCAAESLLQIGRCDAKLIEKVVEIFKVHHGMVVTPALKSFVEMGKSNANIIAALVALLKDQESGVRFGAAVSLAKLGKTDQTVIEVLATELNTQGSTSRNYYLSELRQLERCEGPITEALSELLLDPDGFVRFNAAANLVQFGNRDSGVIQVLFDLLKHPSGYIRSDTAMTLEKLGNSDASVLQALVALLKDQDSNVRDISEKAIGNLAQGRSEWTDKQMLADLADNDSSVRERAGIVLAYRWQRVDSELTSQDAERLKDIRDQVKGLRKDARPWVKQASLHALYRIEKRKAELEDEARKKAEQKTTPTE